MPIFGAAPQRCYLKLLAMVGTAVKNDWHKKIPKEIKVDTRA